MEQIVYKPYLGYRFMGWALLGLIICLCVLTYYWILPALFFLPWALLFLWIGRVTLTITEDGIDLRHTINRTDKFLPWDQLKYYRLDNTFKGQEVILLSPVPMDPDVAKILLGRFSFSMNIWHKGVLVIPLSFWKNTDPMRKFIYKKTLHN